MDRALEFASHIKHPNTVAAFALVFVFYALRSVLTAKKVPNRASILAITIIGILGFAPLIASTYLSSRGVYRVRVVVLAPDGQPSPDAEVKSSVGGEIKKAGGNWEYEIPPQVRPADGKVMLFASVKSAFLLGESPLVLGEDYYPTATIRLHHPPNATLRGTVQDQRGRSVAGAQVAISGYPDVVTTDVMGNFALPAHAAEGQVVTVRAQKGDLTAEMSQPVGGTWVLVVKKQ